MSEANIRKLIATAGHTADVETPVATLDELGGRALQWQSSASGLAAWVQPAAAETREEHGRRGMQVTHSVYFAEKPPIDAGDRIIFRGRRLIVSGVTDVGSLGRLWKVDCRETA